MELRFSEAAGAQRTGPASEPSDRNEQPVVTIPDDGLALGRASHGALMLGKRDVAALARIVPAGPDAARAAVLLLGSGDASVFLDGYPPLGAAVLADRAELAIAGERLEYRAFGTQVVAPFESVSGDVRCACCQRVLAAGDRVLRCGACRAPFHEGPRSDRAAPPLLCASYAAACTRCGQSLATSGDASRGAERVPPENLEE